MAIGGADEVMRGINLKNSSGFFARGADNPEGFPPETPGPDDIFGRIFYRKMICIIFL